MGQFMNDGIGTIAHQLLGDEGIPYTAQVINPAVDRNTSAGIVIWRLGIVKIDGDPIRAA